MKRIVILALVGVFIMGMAKVGLAAGIGPVEPLGAMKVEVSGEYNSILDKDIKKNGTITNGNASTGGEVRESTQGYAKVSMGMNDWANIYAKLGTANFEEKLKWNNGKSQTIEYEYGLLWGIGANGLYDLGNNLGIGGDIQVDMWYNDLKSLKGDDSPALINSGSIKSLEFQTAVYLTYAIEVATDLKVVPYVGGCYSYFKAAIDSTISYSDTSDTYTRGDAEGDDAFGLLAGTKIAVGKNLSVNVEGRFISETAVTAGLSYKF